MTTSPLATLDQAELLQLAVTSGRRNDAASSLIYLKEAVSRPDASANAFFLLGAEYAELGLYERAVAMMEKALLLQPDLHLARFQLGFLALSSGDSNKGQQILQVLLEVSESDGVLANFSQALIHLIHNDFDAALRCFAQGMEKNTTNPSLNNNMQRIVTAINELPPEVRRSSPSQDEAEQASLQHLMLSVYSTTQH